MGCSSNRKKQTREFADQKWDYINLQDFKARGCGPGFAYGYLWFMLIISIAVYAVDTFTAVNLLAFNRWSSKIKPTIPFDVSKCIFSVCILLSFVNLAFEGFRAIRVMKRGNVAECFLDSLAVRWESIRFGQGQGWKRFLVFAELTKSKKGSEYVALFTYFSFKSWIRVIFCSGPRQVVNALTLRSVYQAKLAPTATSVDGAILGFFDKIKVLASEDYQQAVILSGMCFTFVVWAFSALFLLMAVLFYVFFLFHWIPRADGGLAAYCERKVNKKLLRIVTKKVNKALAKGQANRLKAELEFAKRNGEKLPHLDRAATLPTVPIVQRKMEDSLPQMPSMGHAEETNSTLPMYTSRPSPPGNFELGAMGGRHRMQRTGTAGSMSSHSSRAPLTSSAAKMGYAQKSQSPESSLADVDFNTGIARPIRSATSNSQRPGFGPMNSSPTANPFRQITASPANDNMTRCHGHARPLTNRSVDSNATAPPAMGRTTTGPMTYQPYNSYVADRRASPTTSVATHRTAGGFPPSSRSMTGPVGSVPPRRGAPPVQHPPSRTMTAPIPTEGAYDWSETAQGMRGGPAPMYRGGPYGYDVESQPHNRRYY